MSTVIFDVLDENELKASFVQAFETGEPQTPRISFASPALMFKALGGRRLELVMAMAGAGPMGVREIARLTNRDVRAVHADIQTLLSCGIFDKLDNGKVEFPYDAVHVDFMLKAA